MCFYMAAARAKKNEPLVLSGVLGHQIPLTAIDICEDVMVKLRKELQNSIELFGLSGLTERSPADYLNGRTVSNSSTLNSPHPVDSDMNCESNRYLLRLVLRLRLYLAVLIEKLEVPPSLLIVSEEMVSWNIELATAVQEKRESAVISRLVSRLNIQKLAEEDSLTAAKLSLNSPDDLVVNKHELVEAANDVRFVADRIAIISSFMNKRILELGLCSRLLLKNMLSMIPSLWESMMKAVATKIVQIYFLEIISCLESNFTALGILISKEVSAYISEFIHVLKIKMCVVLQELVVRARRPSWDGFDRPPIAATSSYDNGEENTVVNKKLVAVQLYELLSVFAAKNSVFDQAIRDALLTFALEPNSSYSICLADFLNLDELMAKWSSVLNVEMRAWVDSVISVSKASF